MKRNNILFIAAFSMLIITTVKSVAQVSPPTSMYFLNEYLYNPAAAGNKQGLNVGLSYKNNLTGSNGQTVGNTITIDYGKNKNGFGLYFNSDKEGFLNVSKFAATYAYNLQTSSEGNVRFGLSLGATNFNINWDNVVGDATDGLLNSLADSELVFDGDFGVYYADKKIALSAVAPNLRAIFNSDHIGNYAYNYSKYYFSAAYNLYAGQIKFTPKAMYRGIEGFDGVLDIGGNAEFANGDFSLMAFYHSTNNVSVGLGFDILEKCKLQASYALPMSSNMKNYTHGAVELGLKLNLNK